MKPRDDIARRMAAVLVAGALATGCAALESNKRAATGTAVGAATGAGAGAAIGAIAGNKAGEGAAIGAIVGAVGGGAVGAYMDKQQRDLEAAIGSEDQVRRDGDQLALTMSGDFLFDTGSAELAPGARSKLARVARVLVDYPETTLEVIGHTDATGSDAVNQRLSEQRADAVASELMRQGIDQSRIVARGIGASEPVASNDSADGRARNRRVEIEVIPI